jgi:hypothetical protein
MRTVASVLLVLIAAPAIWAHASSQAAQAPGAAITLRVKDSKRYAAETKAAVTTALFVVRPELTGAEMRSQGMRFAVAYGTIALSNMAITCDAYAGPRPTGTATVATQEDFIVNVRFVDRYPKGQDSAVGALGMLFVDDSASGRSEFANYVVAVQHSGPKGTESQVAFNDMGIAQIMQYFGLATKTSLPVESPAPPVVIEREGEQFHVTLSAKSSDVSVIGKIPLTVCPATQ